MRIFAIISIISVVSSYAVAQENFVGARSVGMGTTTTVPENVWSIFQNVAGLGSLKHTAALFGYTNHYGLSDGLQTLGAGVAMPIKAGGAGVGVSRFGDPLFSMHTITMGYGHRINQFNMGISVQEHQYSMEGFGSRFATSVSVGGIARLLPELRWGLHIRHLNRPLVSRITQERIPSVVQTGIAYMPAKMLLLNLEAVQEIGQALAVKTGAEYNWKEKLALRTGINHQIRQHYFGIGLKHPVIGLDYALSSHARLGMSHHVSLAYHLKDK